MKRRITTAAATACTMAMTLLLTACGGGDTHQPEQSGKVAGSERADKPSRSEPASPSPPTGADRPKIELPADITYTFEWQKTGDKVKDAILADSEQSIKAVDMAIARQKSLDGAYEFYYSGEAAAGTETFIQRYVDHKARTTGQYRFYNETVSVNKDGTGSLSYCEDQGKAYVKHLDTGRVDKTPVTKDSYVVYNTALKKNDQGVWVIQKMSSTIGDPTCRP